MLTESTYQNNKDDDDDDDKDKYKYNKKDFCQDVNIWYGILLYYVDSYCI